MNLAQQFELLGRKQLAIDDGIELLKQVQTDLRRTRSSADTWGATVVIANAILIPLNCIVNAFELKAANTLYQIVVRQLYAQFSKSGTRLDGPAKATLSLLKQAILSELKRKAMTEFVPGVNILVGLTEDSLAAWQAAQLVQAGAIQMNGLSDAIDRKISTATRQLMQIGIQRAEVLGRLQSSLRTA